MATLSDVEHKELLVLVELEEKNSGQTPKIFNSIGTITQYNITSIDENFRINETNASQLNQRSLLKLIGLHPPSFTV